MYQIYDVVSESLSRVGIVRIFDSVVDIFLFGVLQFGKNSALVNSDLLIFVVNQGAAKVQEMSFVIVLNVDFIDQFTNGFTCLLNLLLVEQNCFVVGEKLSQQLDGLAVVSCSNSLDVVQVIFIYILVLLQVHFLPYVIFYY
jgi:hypothetical protein